MAIKGLILAAGYGTRFLPVTRCVPKEMLPLIDRPAIDLVVQELRDAGIDELIVVTSRRKKVLDDWFDHDAELEAVFAREGATAKLAKIKPPGGSVALVRQRQMLGAGHAILQAAPFLGTDPFVLAYPDDLFGRPNCTRQLIETWERTGCTVLAAHDLPGQDVSRYGVLDVTGDRVNRIVEKPAPGAEPSTLVSLGRYLYTPDFLDALGAGWTRHEPTSGEYYPMGAINELAAHGRVVAQVVDAPRYDTGEPLGFLQTLTELALERPDIGPAYRDFLRKLLSRDAG